MKKLFTLFAFLAVVMGAKAVEITDAFVDFSQFTDISEVPFASWRGSGSAFDRLSLQDGCLHFESSEATDPSWDCQFFPIGGVNAEVGITYTLHFKVKGDHDGNVSMLGFGQTPYGQFHISTEWVEGTVNYECTDANGNILMQCGDWVGTWDIAYLKITHEGREQKPVDWKNILTNGDASTPWENPSILTSDEGWEKVCAWSKEYKRRDAEENELVHPADIEDGVFVCRTDEVNPPLVWDSDGEQWGQQHSAGDPKPDNGWQNQFWIALPRTLVAGEPYKVSFKYKASEAARVTTQNHGVPGSYIDGGQVGELNFTTEWQTYESKELSATGGMQSIAFNFGEDKQYEKNIIFYFDDIEVSVMDLREGWFAAGIDANKTNFNLFNFDEAITLEYDAQEDAYVGVVGTADEDGWVNQAMISTAYGHDKGFKAATITVKGKITNDPDNWLPYEKASNAKINFPARGQWKIFVAPEDGVIAFQKLVGEADKVAEDIVTNTTEVIVKGQERQPTASEQPADPDAGIEEGTGQPWDNQFFIIANRVLEAGEVTIVKFQYKANKEAKTTTQTHGQPGGYIHWAAIGDVNFTEEWQDFEYEYTVPSEADGKNAQSIAFNMAEIKEACDYELKNFQWYLKYDEEGLTMENLIDAEGAKNFFVKEGAGTTPHEFGTDPETDGINSVVTNNNASAVIYNLAGQRVDNGYKGIVVKSGKKVMMK